jgi:hypothetical protein
MRTKGRRFPVGSFGHLSPLSVRSGLREAGFVKNVGNRMPLRKADAAALCGLELADGSPAAFRSISRFAGTGFLFHRFLSGSQERMEHEKA